MGERYGHKNVVQQGDEYVCYVCHRRWDAQDERNGEVPQCTMVPNEAVYGGRKAKTGY